MADDFEELYERDRRAPARRGRQARGAQAARRRATSCTWTSTCTPTTRPTARRRWTRCSTPRSGSGLGAIAITDHNEISGALEARERAERDQGDRGRGGEDRRPGRGDRPLHRGEDPARHDARRRRSPRSAARGASSTCRIPSTGCMPCPTTSTCWTWWRTSTRSRSSTRAWRSRRSTRRPRASRPSTGSWRAPGSDSHVAQGLGSVKIRMRDFDGPEEFLESLRDADIVRKQAVAALRPGAEVHPDARQDAVMRAKRSGRQVRQKPVGRCPPLTTRSARSTSSGRSAS